MITIQLLELTDTIEPTDWCRPLAIEYSANGYGDTIHTSSCYTGTPINNMKWVQVKHVVGSCWFGKTVKDFNGTGYSKYWPVETRMEFVRGDIPKVHRLDMKGYNSMAKLEKNINQYDDVDDDIPF